MSSSYNTNIVNNSNGGLSRSVIEQNLLFEDKEILNDYKDEDGNPAIPTYVSGSRIWFWDKSSEQWVLQHAVVVGNETIKQGPPGEIGKSAYQSYLDTTEDFPPLSEADWVQNINGTDGENGLDGTNGNNGINGDDGDSGEGPQGEKGDDGAAICEATEGVQSGEKGKLWIDGLNQIIVTLG